MVNGIFHLSTSKRYHVNKALYSVDELAMFDSVKSPRDTNLIHMSPLFKNEFRFEQKKPNKYFNAQQRIDHTVTFNHLGQLKNASDKLLEGIFIFVELADERIIAASAAEITHHSFVSAGLPVISAGYLFCASGALMTVSNNSGHYKPHRDHIKDHLSRLCEASQNPMLVFEDHTDMTEGNLSGPSEHEETHVKWSRASQFLTLNKHDPIARKDLGGYFQKSLSVNLNRIADASATSEPSEEHALGALDSEACAKTSYTFEDKTTEEERDRVQAVYRENLANLYTMQNLGSSHYGRKSSLSCVRPN